MTAPRPLHPIARRRSAGFTLLELMVSIAIGLIVMAGLVSVFVNVSRTNSEMTKSNSMIEAGRYAIDILQEEIQHAGYWGGFVPVWDDFSVSAIPGDTPAIVPDPCLAVVNWAGTAGHLNALIGIPLQTYSTTGEAADGNVPSGIAGCSAVIVDRKRNTDVLVVRRSELCEPGTGNCEADDANKVHFQPSFCPATSPAVLSGAGTADAAPYVLGTTGFTMQTRACNATAAPKRRFISSIYYVRTWSTDPGGVKDGVPTLVRASFNLGGAGGSAGFEPAESLIEGVDAFVADLGLDQLSRCNTAVDYAAAPVRWSPALCAVSATAVENTLLANRGDGVPDAWARCPAGGCTVAQLRDAVAVRVYVLARSRDAGVGQVDDKTYTLGGVAGSQVVVSPAGGDKFRRHLYQSAVRMHNISGRRETP